jgi:glycosyltransferase involved in cell wall biosynthesis
MNKKLNIVSLNVPWPANYGGVIDIYYKLKALHDCGVKIILHCFQYGRPRAAALEEVCEEVHYYRRQTGLRANVTLLPYNVYSRKAPALIARLLDNDYPILFEGLHSCYYLNDRRLEGRIKIFRECNIEHTYYRKIALAEKHLLRKGFHCIEAIRFKWFQKNVAHADLMIAVSMTDANYLQRKFPHNRVEFIPCFHGNDRITAVPGTSDFLLYHGNLSVMENEKAAAYLINHVFCHLPYPCLIAGMEPSERLRNLARLYPNILIEANPRVDRIRELIREAHINVLVTFQDTGLKLKLLNSLFAGRHLVVNPPMMAGSGLDSLCHIGDTPEQLIAYCRRLMITPFDAAAIEERSQALYPTFSDACQAERLVQMIDSIQAG